MFLSESKVDSINTVFISLVIHSVITERHSPGVKSREIVYRN